MLKINLYDKDNQKVKELTECYMDGYSVGERQLEGVPIKLKIFRDTIQAEFLEESSSYLKQYSKRQKSEWLEYAVEKAIDDELSPTKDFKYDGNVAIIEDED